MSAVIQQEKPAANNVGSAAPNGGDSPLTKFMSGPGAELFSIMSTIMQLCNKIQQQSAMLTRLSTGASLSETQTAASSIQSAANDQAYGEVTQGVQSLTQAVVCGVQAKAMISSSNTMTSDSAEPLANIEHQNEFISNLSGGPAGAATGEDGAPGLPEGAGEEEVEERMTALKNNLGADFDASSPTDVAAAQRLGQEDPDLIQRVQENRDLSQKTVNAKMTEAQSKQTMVQMMGQVVTNIVTAVADGAKAHFDSAKGWQDANVTNAQWGSQTDTAAAQATSAQLDLWFKTLQETVDALGAASKVSQ